MMGRDGKYLRDIQKILRVALRRFQRYGESAVWEASEQKPLRLTSECPKV